MATIAELAALSDAAYGGAVPSGWDLLPISCDTSNGYFGVAFRRVGSDEIVIANRGTEADSLADLLTDFQLATGQATNAQVNAIAFAEAVVEYAKTLTASPEIIATGHSLGGSEAQAIVASLVDNGILSNDSVSAVTFNAPGIAGNFTPLNSLDSYHVLNLSARGDIIHLAGGAHLGSSVTLEAGPSSERLLVLAALSAASPLTMAAAVSRILYETFGPGHSLDTLIGYLNAGNGYAIGQTNWSAGGLSTPLQSENSALEATYSEGVLNVRDLENNYTGIFEIENNTILHLDVQVEGGSLIYDASTPQFTQTTIDENGHAFTNIGLGDGVDFSYSGSSAYIHSMGGATISLNNAIDVTVDVENGRGTVTVTGGEGNVIRVNGKNFEQLQNGGAVSYTQTAGQSKVSWITDYANETNEASIWWNSDGTGGYSSSDEGEISLSLDGTILVTSSKGTRTIHADGSYEETLADADAGRRGYYQTSVASDGSQTTTFYDELGQVVATTTNNVNDPDDLQITTYYLPNEFEPNLSGVHYSTNIVDGVATNLIYSKNGSLWARTTGDAEGFYPEEATLYFEDKTETYLVTPALPDEVLVKIPINLDLDFGYIPKYYEGALGSALLHWWSQGGGGYTPVVDYGSCEYSPTGRLAKWTFERNGNICTYEYNGNGTCSSYEEKGAPGSAVEYKKYTYYMNGNSKTKEERYAGGSVSLWNYDANGSMTGFYSYAPDGGSMEKEINPDGSYTSRNNTILITGGFQQIINNYDSDGVSLETTTTNFDTDGDKVHSSWHKADGSYGEDSYFPDGTAYGSMFDADGNLIGRWNLDATGYYSKHRFNAGGLITFTEWRQADGTFGTETRSYNSSGAVTYYLWESSDGSSRTIYSDGQGNGHAEMHNADGSYLTYVTEEYAVVSTVSYNSDGKKIWATWQGVDGLSGSDNYEYDEQGNEINHSWARSDGTSGWEAHNYDEEGNQLNHTAASFNSNGKMVQFNWEELDGLSGSDNYEYDEQGNLTKHLWEQSDGSFGWESYDEQGNRIVDRWQNLDGSYNNHTYVYDDVGNVISDTYIESDDGLNEISGEKSYTYDEDGNRVTYSWSKSDGTFGSATYSYDENGNEISRLWQKSDGTYGEDEYNEDGSSEGILHYADGRYCTYVEDSQGTIHRWNYDSNGILLNSEFEAGANANLVGTSGDDIYTIEKYTGAVTISDPGGNNTLNLEEVTVSDVIVKMNGTDLVLMLENDDPAFPDSVTLKDWSAGQSWIDFKFNDGTILYASDINEMIQDVQSDMTPNSTNQLIQAMAAFSPQSMGKTEIISGNDSMNSPGLLLSAH